MLALLTAAALSFVQLPAGPEVPLPAVEQMGCQVVTAPDGTITELTKVSVRNVRDVGMTAYVLRWKDRERPQWSLVVVRVPGRGGNSVSR